eukprot:920447-Pyramimonas_sp.AAC.1
MTRLWLSSGEKVAKIGTTYRTRSALVSNRMTRRVSCVPGSRREVCSMFARNLWAALPSPGT